jgi:hypothetical protein
MPNDITSNIRDLLIDAVVDRLKDITKANGYQTQPLVTELWARAEQAEEKYIVWVEVGNEEPKDFALPAARMYSLTLIIRGFVRPEEGGIRQDINKLLQDVRENIETYWLTLISVAGTGISPYWGLCETDSGDFMKDGRGQFAQELILTYKQGANW